MVNISIGDTVKFYPTHPTPDTYDLLCEYTAKVINIEFDPECDKVVWVGLEFDFDIDAKLMEKTGDKENKWSSCDACNHTGTLSKCAWYSADIYKFEKIK